MVNLRFKLRGMKVEMGVGKFLRVPGTETLWQRRLPGRSFPLFLSVIRTIFAVCRNGVHMKSALTEGLDLITKPHFVPWKSLWASHMRTLGLRDILPLGQKGKAQNPSTLSSDSKWQSPWVSDTRHLPLWPCGHLSLALCAVSLGVICEERNEEAELLKD